jgi:hypothetical protein
MNMYYVKISNVYDKGDFHTYEYIATVLGLEHVPGNPYGSSSYQKLDKVCVLLEIHASTQEWNSNEIKRRDLMEITQMNDPSGVSPSRMNCEYYWQKAAYVTFPRVESDS